MTTSDVAKRRSFVRWIADMPRWEQLVLLAAVAALVVGAVLTWMAPSAPAPGGASGGAPDGLGESLLPGQPRGSSPPAEPAQEPAAKGVFRLGFSFLAGFCIGAFVRAALRVVAIAVGFWLAMTFVLSYFDLVVVDWQQLDALWTRFLGNVESEWGDFRRFVTGSLPAAGLATAGLALGLKRH